MRENLCTVLLLASAAVNFYLLWLNWRTLRFAGDMQKQRDEMANKMLSSYSLRFPQSGIMKEQIVGRITR